MLAASVREWHGGVGDVEGAFNAISVGINKFAEESRFPRLAPTVIPDTSGLSDKVGEGWSISDGTSWHFGLEFTPAGPEAYGLISYSQSSDAGRLILPIKVSATLKKIIADCFSKSRTLWLI